MTDTRSIAGADGKLAAQQGTHAAHEKLCRQQSQQPEGEGQDGEAPAARAQVRALTLAIACDIHPLNNLRVLNYLRDPLAQADAEVHAWYAHWIARGFTALEQEVRDLSGDGRHMFGNAVTVADVFMVPQMANARRERCDVEPYPRLRAICEYLESLPAFARAAPQAQSQP
jgi:maleylacetoacetate isomerase